MKPLREVVAEAIRADGSDLCDRPWDQISDENKIGWLGDADRAIEAMNRHAAAELRGTVLSAEAVIQAAHDLLCWTYQHAINVEPHEYSRNVKDLHPGVYNTMNSAEQDLYIALQKHNAEQARLRKVQA